MTVGSEALDSIAVSLVSVRPSGREVALLALAAAVARGVTAACPSATEFEIRQIVDEFTRRIRARLDRLES
jgi:hypothetical protein